MNLKISVVLCTHNPREDYLQRTIGALKQQTVPFDQWELLLVDNASTSRPPEKGILTWHPFGKTIEEPQLGLTMARLRGIAESSAPLIVFVDDDNVLDPSYLANALKIADTRPYLAAFGGNVTGEFETPPRPHLHHLLCWLAILQVNEDTWGCSRSLDPAPVGAGLCVRREVAVRYAQDLETQMHRRKLDRQGNELISGGDNDLILTAMDMGFAAGVFVHLHLTHLIPKERLTDAYFIRMAEGMTYTQVLFSRMGRSQPLPVQSWKRKLLNSVKLPFMSSFERQMAISSRRGLKRALSVPLPPLQDPED